MKLLQISEPASREIVEAVRWYEERRPGWGVRLLEALSATFGLTPTVNQAVDHVRSDVHAE